MATLVEPLVERQLFIRHEVQAIAAKEPQQVARYPVGDLRIAAEDLAEQILAEIGVLFGRLGQSGDQFIEAVEEQCVVLRGHLLGCADVGQDRTQLGEEGDVMGEIGSGHGCLLKKRLRSIGALSDVVWID